MSVMLVYNNSVDILWQEGCFPKSKFARKTGNSTLKLHLNLITESPIKRNSAVSEIRWCTAGKQMGLVSQSDQCSCMWRLCKLFAAAATIHTNLQRRAGSSWVVSSEICWGDRDPTSWGSLGAVSWKNDLGGGKSSSPVQSKREAQKGSLTTSILIWQKDRGETWNDARLQCSQLRAELSLLLQEFIDQTFNGS